MVNIFAKKRIKKITKQVVVIKSNNKGVNTHKTINSLLFTRT